MFDAHLWWNVSKAPKFFPAESMVPSLTWTTPLKTPVKEWGRESLWKGQALFALGGEWARGMWAEREPCKAWERDTIVPYSYPLSQIRVKEAWGHSSCCSAWTHNTGRATLRPARSSQQLRYAHSSKPFCYWRYPLSHWLKVASVRCEPGLMRCSIFDESELYINPYSIVLTQTCYIIRLHGAIILLFKKIKCTSFYVAEFR